MAKPYLRFSIALTIFVAWIVALTTMVIQSSEKPREIPAATSTTPQ